MATSLGATTPSVSFSSSSSSCLNVLCFSNSSPSIKLHNSYSAPTLTLNSLPLSSLPLLSNKKFFKFELYSTVQEVAVEETQEEVPLKVTQEQEGSSDEKKKKLFIVNLPWGYAVSDIKKLLGECGTVKDVEIIKAKDGRHKGYAFITMASADESQAVIDKFDSYELSGRIIRVEFAKGFKKPSPPRVPGTPSVETRHKLYVTNLSWKARASHLREFFSAECNPVSARVVFNGPSSTGYGFVSFATKEEAEAAISSMDGKELLGRPIRLKFSEKSMDSSGNELEENSSSGGQKVAEDSTDKPEGS
ncbi:29 kDa ribonucleoprotein [Thalictrum thalictroides]|uniref:29 kDa ribonucleoprotein n=1 Tax=Thalictrum thalictroides TaxID=46969 RepID=A0A7J6VCN1_THATH|nr:29 kDa ribonucleoprotein [Thalictrum thalictroides]